jgi:hypothetical protein
LRPTWSCPSRDRSPESWWALEQNCWGQGSKAEQRQSANERARSE